MHKSYYTIKPCQSKMLQAKWDQKYYDEHRQKLREIYPVIDTRAPKTYMHMHLKLKKIRLEEEKLYLIERDNRLLLEKMSNIMRTRGRIDNQNNYESKSLSRSRKQRELLRIAKENEEIMQRIFQQRPQYSVDNWNRDWNKNLDFIDNISTYPDNWWLKTYHPRNAQSLPRDEVRSEDNSEEKNKKKDKKQQKKRERKESKTESENKDETKPGENKDETKPGENKDETKPAEKEESN